MKFVYNVIEIISNAYSDVIQIISDMGLDFFSYIYIIILFTILPVIYIYLYYTSKIEKININVFENKEISHDSIINIFKNIDFLKYFIPLLIFSCIIIFIFLDNFYNFNINIESIIYNDNDNDNNNNNNNIIKDIDIYTNTSSKNFLNVLYIIAEKNDNFRVIFNERVPIGAHNNANFTEIECMFARHNIVNLICVYSIIVIALTYVIRGFFNYVQTNKIILINKYPVFIVKIISFIGCKFTIIMLDFGIFLQFIAISYGIFSLYFDFLPPNISYYIDIINMKLFSDIRNYNILILIWIFFWILIFLNISNKLHYSNLIYPLIFNFTLYCVCVILFL